MRRAKIKKPLVYFLLVLSMLLWVAVFVVPFLELSTTQIATTITILIISAEVCFLLSALLMGKEAWHKIKTVLIKKTRGQD